MISMSYARTFAGGDGLVWFPGADRVEGYSNPLWVLVMAAVHLLHLPAAATVGVMILLSLTAVVIAALLASRIAQEHFDVRSLAGRFASTFAVAGSFPLVFFGGRGMEVGLLTALTLGLILALLRARAGVPSAAVIVTGSAAGMLTRTDFVVVVGAATLWLVLTTGTRRPLLPLLSGTAATLAALTVFRLAYFGDPLPNTYYLKLTRIPLDIRLERGLAVGAVTTLTSLLAAAIVLAVVWQRTDRRSPAALLGLVALAQLAYSTYVGGDAWEEYMVANRYLAPAVACLALAAVACLARHLEQHRPETPAVIGAVVAAAVLAFTVPVVASKRPGLAALVAAVVTVGVLTGGAVAARRRMPVGHVVTGMIGVALASGTWAGAVSIPTGIAGGTAAMGAQLAEVTEPGTTIAVVAAGGTQYFSARPAIDLLGKMDPVVAHGPTSPEVPFKPGHSKFNYRHSIRSLQPDVIAQLYLPSDPAALAEVRRGGYVLAALREGRFQDGIPWSGESVILVSPEAAVDWSKLRRVDPGPF